MVLYYRLLLILAAALLPLLFWPADGRQVEAVDRLAAAPQRQQLPSLAQPLDDPQRAALARVYAQLGLQADGRRLEDFLPIEPDAASRQRWANLATAMLAAQQPLPPVTQASPGPAAAAAAPAAGDLQQDRHLLRLRRPGIYTDLQLLPEQVDAGSYRVEAVDAQAYAISFLPEDAGALLVDGGLVVPGRWYALGDGLSITSGRQLRISIRPRPSSAPLYPLPIPLPAGDG